MPQDYLAEEGAIEDPHSGFPRWHASPLRPCALQKWSCPCTVGSLNLNKHCGVSKSIVGCSQRALQESGAIFTAQKDFQPLALQTLEVRVQFRHTK